MTRCKVLLHNNINIYFKSLKDMYEKFQEKEKRLKKLLHEVGTLRLQVRSRRRRGTTSFTMYRLYAA